MRSGGRPLRIGWPPVVVLLCSKSAAAQHLSNEPAGAPKLKRGSCKPETIAIRAIDASPLYHADLDYRI